MFGEGGMLIIMRTESNEHSKALPDQASDLDVYLTRRSEALEKIYGNTWTPSEVEELRQKTKAATARARKIREEWGLA